MTRPKVFSIPPGPPFLATFVEALFAGRLAPDLDLADPLAVAEIVIYTPTRRSARALAREWESRAPSRACLLPRIRPLGAFTLDEAEAADADDPETSNPREAAPEAIDSVERRLVLTSLILAWTRAMGGPTGSTPGQAWALSSDLADLIDEFTIEDVPWSALNRLAPEEFDDYWSETTRFLSVAGEHWPAFLKERGLVDAVARRASEARAAAARLESEDGPAVFAIGSTGTNAATAALLRAIARSGRGAVVLPGLDRTLDEAAWSRIGDAGATTAASHPQAALRRVLATIGVTRDEVGELGIQTSAIHDRFRFVSEAMAPAETTERWRGVDRNLGARALAGVDLIEAADEREEALAIAVRLRALLEGPEGTAALITPDRGLAARVRMELARWAIDIDDSAGEPLAARPLGALARLVLKAAARPEGSHDWVALLAHPLTRLDAAPARARELAALAEIAVARRWTASVEALDARLDEAEKEAGDPRAHAALRAVDARDWRDLHAWLAALDAALSGLRGLTRGASFGAWTAAHREAVRRLATDDPDEDEERALADLFERLENGARDLPLQADSEDYRRVFEELARETPVRDARPAHPRLSVLGLLEARLLAFDHVVLAGLDETLWPPSASSDPFLNRSMRAILGLSSPERRLGQTAHDFAQALGAPAATLSRAKKRGGAPTTPSRFLQRMEALAGPQAWDAARARGAIWIDYARALDASPPAAPIGPPKPRPPVALRPRRLSVTRIETLRRDPYAIYAESILRLRPLPPIEAPTAARVVGEALHEALATSVRDWPDRPPPDLAERLLAFARARLEPHFADVDWRTFVWPRHERALVAYAQWDAGRRDGLASLHVEGRGALDLTLEDGSVFKLTAVADRLEQSRDGGWTIIDFKTGRAPSPKEVAAGFSPQLTLEAAMLERGAFGAAARGAVVERGLYLLFAGGDFCEKAPTSAQTPPFAVLARDHFDGAVALLSQFNREETPYLSRPYPQFASRFGDYDHLARVKEWASGGDAEESA